MAVEDDVVPAQQPRCKCRQPKALVHVAGDVSLLNLRMPFVFHSGQTAGMVHSPVGGGHFHQHAMPLQCLKKWGEGRRSLCRKKAGTQDRVRFSLHDAEPTWARLHRVLWVQGLRLWNMTSILTFGLNPDPVMHEAPSKPSTLNSGSHRGSCSCQPSRPGF